MLVDWKLDLENMTLSCVSSHSKQNLVPWIYHAFVFILGGTFYFALFCVVLFCLYHESLNILLPFFRMLFSLFLLFTWLKLLAFQVSAKIPPSTETSFKWWYFLCTSFYLSQCSLFYITMCNNLFHEGKYCFLFTVLSLGDNIIHNNSTSSFKIN